MDKLAFYGSLVKQTLEGYATLVARQPQPGVEGVVVFDEERHHYLWLQTGWGRRRRVYVVTVHIRLHNGKIQIEQDWTEDGIATDLLRARSANRRHRARVP